MNECVGRLVAREGGEGPMAGTAVASFLVIPPQEEPHHPVQALLAALTGANGDHAREIVGAFPDQFM
jgi:hypothetical protein